MTRNGKIARLPRVVRDELNQRLADGEQGTRLVAWLNGRPDVQAVLKTDFSGRPITENNLSEWKRGGFEDWLQQQESFDLAGGILEEAGDREALTKDGRLSTCVAEMAVLSLAQLINATRGMEEGTQQRRTILRVVREVVRLRASDRSYEEALRKKELHEQQAVISEFLRRVPRKQVEEAAVAKIRCEYDPIRPNTA